MFVSLLALCLLAVTTSANQPGAELVLSKQGANYAVNVALDFVSQLLTGLDIPGVSGKKGDVTYGLDWAKILSFRRPNAQVGFNPSYGIRWTGQNAGLQVKGHVRYKYKKWIISVGDDMDITSNVDGINFQIDTSFTHSGDKIYPKVGGCSVSIRTLGLTIHGGKWYLKWIYDVMKGFVEDIIKKEVEGQVCKAVADQVKTNLANLLKNLNLKVNLQKDFFIDLGFTGVPSFTTDYIASPHKASIYYKTPVDTSPIEYKPIQGTRATARMAKLLFSEHVANGLSYQANKHGLLKWPIPLPNDWKQFLSGIIACAADDISLGLQSNEYPTVSVKKTGISVSAGLRLRPQCKTVDLFSIEVTSTISGNLTLTNKVIKPKIRFDSFDYKISPPIPGLDDQKAKDFIRMATTALTEIVNGNTGLDLTNILDNLVPNVRFENAALSTDAATALVETDILYKA